jgi:hypothetical protein
VVPSKRPETPYSIARNCGASQIHSNEFRPVGAWERGSLVSVVPRPLGLGYRMRPLQGLRHENKTSTRRGQTPIFSEDYINWRQTPGVLFSVLRIIDGSCKSTFPIEMDRSVCFSALMGRDSKREFQINPMHTFHLPFAPGSPNRLTALDTHQIA